MHAFAPVQSSGFDDAFDSFDAFELMWPVMVLAIPLLVPNALWYILQLRPLCLLGPRWQLTLDASKIDLRPLSVINFAHGQLQIRVGRDAKLFVESEDLALVCNAELVGEELRLDARQATSLSDLVLPLLVVLTTLRLGEWFARAAMGAEFPNLNLYYTLFLAVLAVVSTLRSLLPQPQRVDRIKELATGDLAESIYPFGNITLAHFSLVLAPLLILALWRPLGVPGSLYGGFGVVSIAALCVWIFWDRLSPDLRDFWNEHGRKTPLIGAILFGLVALYGLGLALGAWWDETKGGETSQTSAEQVPTSPLPGPVGNHVARAAENWTS